MLELCASPQKRRPQRRDGLPVPFSLWASESSEVGVNTPPRDKKPILNKRIANPYYTATTCKTHGPESKKEDPDQCDVCPVPLCTVKLAARGANSSGWAGARIGDG
jgi:hypothetical protein